MSKRLIIVTDQWGAKMGGCEAYLAELAKGVLAQGGRTDVLCRRSREPLDDSNVVEIPCTPFPRWLSEWSFGRRARSWLRKESGSPVLAVRPLENATHYQPHGGLYRLAFRAEGESLDAPLRRWLHPIGTALNLKRNLLVERQEKLLTKKDVPGIMVFSKRMRRQLQNLYQVSSCRIFACPLGVNLDSFRPADIDGADTGEGDFPWRGDPRILFVGHNFTLKGLHCLFQALSRVKGPARKFHLAVAGNGPVKSFGRIARKLSIDDRVSFLGGVNRDRLIRLYRTAHALAHPTFYDHCSLVVLEALACGCPVITTERNGASELLRNGGEGIIMDDPRDTRVLAETLESLEDGPMWRRMGRRGSRLMKKYSWKDHLQRTFGWLGLKIES